MGLSDQPFDVMCPECGGMLKVDPVTRSVIAHTPAVRKKTFGDFGEAARALEAADARRDSLFAQSVIAHTPAVRKKTFGDFGEAARALEAADARRDSLFAQSVEAEKNKDDVMAKKFAEAVKKAKQSPLSERPLREFDLE